MFRYIVFLQVATLCCIWVTAGANNCPAEPPTLYKTCGEENEQKMKCFEKKILKDGSFYDESRCKPDSDTPECTDVIVIGIGISGSIICSELLKDGVTTVRGFEQGDSIPAGTNIPSMKENYNKKDSPIVELNLYKQQNNVCGNKNGICDTIAGKGIGGSGAINSNKYIKPTNFKLFGNDVDKEIKSYEDYNNPTNPECYGQDGPLTIETTNNTPALLNTLLDTLMNLGYTTDQDLNCENKNGVMISPSTTKNGRSVTVANTILKAQYNNSNFYITRNCQVNRIRFEGKKAVGIECTQNGVAKTFCAKVIVLAAGVINTPIILLRSGIGPQAFYTENDDTAIVDLPVGQNLYTSVSISIPFTIEAAETSCLNKKTLNQYLENGSGSLSSPGLDQLYGLFKVSSDNSEESKDQSPDIELTASGFSAGCPGCKHNKFSLKATLVEPKSVGSITLTNYTSNADAIIDGNFFDHPRDKHILVAACKKILTIIRTEPLKSKNITIDTSATTQCNSFLLNNDDDDDSFCECFVPYYLQVENSSVGTCAMGEDNSGEDESNGVVNSDFRVKGTDSLYIGDTSVIPKPFPKAHQAVSIGIGALTADSILENEFP